MRAQKLDVQFPSDVMTWPSPYCEALTPLNSPFPHTMRINFWLATWTLYFQASVVILTATLEATWVPVTGDPSLKMESLVINVTHHEKQGDLQVGAYGLPDAVLTILQVRDFCRAWLIKRSVMIWRQYKVSWKLL